MSRYIRNVTALFTTLQRWVDHESIGIQAHRREKGRPSIPVAVRNQIISLFNHNLKDIYVLWEHEQGSPQPLCGIISAKSYNFFLPNCVWPALSEDNESILLQFAINCRRELGNSSAYLHRIIFYDARFFLVYGRVNMRDRRIWGTENPKKHSKSEYTIQLL